MPHLHPYVSANSLLHKAEESLINHSGYESVAYLSDAAFYNAVIIDLNSYKVALGLLKKHKKFLQKDAEQFLNEINVLMETKLENITIVADFFKKAAAIKKNIISTARARSKR